MPKFKVTLEGLSFGNEVSTASVGVMASDETEAEDKATDIARRIYSMKDALVIRTEEV